MGKIKASDHEQYGTFTIIALVIPVLGLILGVMYLVRDSKLDRRLGEHTIALSVFAALVWYFIWFISLPLYVELLMY